MSTESPTLRRLSLIESTMQIVQDLNLSFSISSWGKRTACGTTCCAIGYAALNPKLQAEGLGLRIMDGWGDGPQVRTLTELASQPIPEHSSAVLVEPVFDGKDHWSAIKAFLPDLTYDHCTYIFDQVSYSDILPGNHIAVLLHRLRRAINELIETNAG